MMTLSHSAAHNWVTRRDPSQEQPFKTLSPSQTVAVVVHKAAHSHPIKLLSCGRMSGQAWRGFWSSRCLLFLPWVHLPTGSIHPSLLL